MKNPNPDADKHQDILIWNAENWLYEDFEVGQRTRSIRRTISEGESMMFNGLVLDMHPYVADEVFAKEEGIKTLREHDRSIVIVDRTKLENLAIEDDF